MPQNKFGEMIRTDVRIADVRVDRGDGVLFSFNTEDAQKYLDSHPGSKLAPKRVVAAEPAVTEMPSETSATAASGATAEGEASEGSATESAKGKK